MPSCATGYETALKIRRSRGFVSPGEAEAAAVLSQMLFHTAAATSWFGRVAGCETNDRDQRGIKK